MGNVKAILAFGILQGTLMAAGALPVSSYLIGENSFNADTPAKDADRTWGRMKEARFRLIRIGGISNNDKTPSAESHARWIDSIRSIGAEPLVQVSSIDPASTAADLVRALNVQKKYGVRFWCIGNEQTCVEKPSAAKMATIAANAKERALAMKAVDPGIKILFGDECYWKPEFYGPLIGGANDVTGEANGIRYIDGVTFHTYPLPGASKETPYTRNDVLFNAIPNVRGQFMNCRKAAAAADSMHGRTGAARLSISLTEFNVTYWNSSDNSPAGVGVRSFLAGQFVAEVFGMGIENGAFTVAPWSMMESGGNGGAGDLGLFDGNGAVVPRPAYHHIKMIADNMSGTGITAVVEKADLLHAYATQNGDTAAILLLNENLANGYRITVKLNSGGAGSASTPTVRADAGWDGELTDTVPAQSTLLLKIRKPGVVATRTVYTLPMAEKFQAPTVKEFPVALGQARSRTAAQFRILNGRLEGDLETSGPYHVELMDGKGRVVSELSGYGNAWTLGSEGSGTSLRWLRVSASGKTWVALVPPRDP